MSWYRPPDSSINVFDKLENILQDIETHLCDFVLVGDLNCDVLHNPPSNNTNRLYRVANEYGLTQCVKTATRVSKHSQTLIDHVYTSTADNVTRCNVVPLSLSDHDMVIFSWRKCKPKFDGNHCYITSRNIKKIDIESFVSDLRQISLNDVLDEDSIENAYEIWVNKIRFVLNKHAPVKKKRVRHRKSPWMTREILDLIRKRDQAKKIAKRTNTDVSWENFRKLRNQGTSNVRKAKREYIIDSTGVASYVIPIQLGGGDVIR